MALRKVRRNLKVLRAVLPEETKGYQSSLPIRTINRYCSVSRSHPDLTDYVGVPKESYNCSVTIGITGYSVGRPEYNWAAMLHYLYLPGQLGHISEVYVWEPFRRSGFGSALINYTLDDMKKFGVKTVYSGIISPEGEALLRSLGFSNYRDTPLLFKQLEVPVETKRSDVQIPQSLIVYRGYSDKHHEEVMKEGFYPSHGQDKVYTATEMHEAVRFAYAHVNQEGGKPIVYELKVPLERFNSQIFYSGHATGFLTSGPLEPSLIQNFYRIPTDSLDEQWKIIDQKELEEKAREVETRLMLAKIPEEHYTHKRAAQILAGYQTIFLPHGAKQEMKSRVQTPAGAPNQTLELKQQFGSELKAMIEETERQGREVGAMLCRHTTSGNLHLSRACYGRRASVMVTNCHDGLAPLGSYHTHLKGVDLFSVQDLDQALKKEQISCLGYSKNGVPTLKCIMPKRYYEYPPAQQGAINQSLDQARQDLERATSLSLKTPSNPEVIALSQRAQTILRNIEQQLDSYEVTL